MTEQNTTTAPATEAAEDAQAPQDAAAQQAPTPVPAEDQKEDQKDAQEDTTAGEPLDALGKLRKEAAGHRVAAKEARADADTARAEADALRSQLTAAQDTILADRLAQDRTGVTLDALKAAGHRDGAFNQDGTINTDALATAVQDTAARFGTMRLQPLPDPTTGRETPPNGGSAGSSWGALLNPGAGSDTGPVT